MKVIVITTYSNTITSMFKSRRIEFEFNLQRVPLPVVESSIQKKNLSFE